MKRTATVTTSEYSTISCLSRKSLYDSKEDYPIIYQKFAGNISKYEDFDFNFRKKMVKNVPPFRNLSDHIIKELVYLLSPKRYEAGQLIV